MSIRLARIESSGRRFGPHDLLRVARILLITVVSWLYVANAFAIDVADYKWGFNGKVAPHRFNLLSVLINNPTPQQFTGEVLLRKSLGLGGGAVDAAIIETVTISPNSQKWVQFYPYITSDAGSGVVTENWSLKYPGGTYDFQTPRLAKYQRIILNDPNSVSAKGGAIKFQLPDNLFPPFVTATDALQLVVLDHIPRWEESRRQAFIDWIYLGGTVVVLQDASGKFPDFAGPMSFLKTPLEDQITGSGRIIRLSMTRSQFSEDDLRQACAGLPKNYQPQNATEKTDDIVDRLDESQQISPGQNFGYSEGTDPFKSTSFLSQLKLMTKPDHNWVLLHFMFWVYIGLVFPGCYLLGKKWSDFRVVYAGLLGTVTLFSLLFSYVGQRGYGEASAVHTVAIAKPLPDGFMDVSGWSNVFVTNGADYDIRHNATGALYSACNDHEAVRGLINNGAEAIFKVDIPPFSNRELASRAKIPFDGLKLNLESIKTSEGRLSELEIAVAGVKQTDVEKQFALIGSSFYALNWIDGKLVLANETGTAVSMLRVQEQRNNMYGNSPWGTQNKQTTAERYTQMFLPLLSRGLNVSREKDAEQIRLAPNVIRVFLYAKIPNEFAMQNNRLGKQEGRVLYCVTLSGTDLKQQ